MAIIILSNPKAFAEECRNKNITLNLIIEAQLCIGKQNVCKMFVGKSKRGSEGHLSSATLENWITTFEFVKNNPEKEDDDKFSGSKQIEKHGSVWDDYIKLINTPIDNEIVESWKKISNKKLGDEAIKYGITLGIRNSEAVKILLNRMNEMVERRKVLFWNKVDEYKLKNTKEESITSYKFNNVPTLHTMCKERGIVSCRMKKDEMINALEKYDNDEFKEEEINYYKMNNNNLKNICKELGMTNYNKLNKDSLVEKIIKNKETVSKIKVVIEEIKIEKSKDEHVSVAENNKVLQTFKFEGKDVRTTGTFENPWFVAKDVCDILELSNNRKAILNIPDKWKGVTKSYTLGGSQEMDVINESGLYKLIMRSNKPNAEKFQVWVCEDVLPSIRKTGSYTISDGKYDEKFEQINMLIKDSPLEDVMNKTKVDKEAQDMCKKFNIIPYTNSPVIYVAYVGNGLIKIGYSDCLLLQREKKHMSCETDFDEFSFIGAFVISSKKIDSLIKDVFVKYRVKFNKSNEIYRPQQDSLKEFVEMIGDFLKINDVEYQLKLARDEIVKLKEELHQKLNLNTNKINIK